MEKCFDCGQYRKCTYCVNCSHLHKDNFKSCDKCKLKIGIVGACYRCTNICSKCNNMVFKSELHTAANWDVCKDCLIEVFK